MKLQLVLEPHADLPALIREAVRGGVTLVQWRDKYYNDRDFYEQGLIVRQVCRELQVPMVVNDRVDIALAIGADGVHIGQSDLPYEVARRILPAHMIIGLTAETLKDVEQAEPLEVAYLALSPVFETHTKEDTKAPFGLEGVRKARSISRHRLIAVGGVNRGNIHEVLNAGADGVAVVSAICRSSSPCEAAKALVV
ncbi:MAG: thiamine phosphate synthase [Myxococcaceae bacterium]|nr:thiamine phosphate synthase [Myxococcaceae bacterium]MBH2006221.1 thiamine phosphate synthase [Myxococcaceae bacterium]